MNGGVERNNWKLAIVILNYEVYQETEKCVDSIMSMGMKYEGIVIVDNASKNESVNYLKRKYEFYNKIKIVRSLRNIGFSKGNNLGIKIAKQTWGVEFVLLLNSDTIMLQEDYIERMMRQCGTDVAVVQSNALKTNQRYTGRTYVHFSLKEIGKEFLNRICDAYDMYDVCGLAHSGVKGELGPFISGCDFLLTPYFFKIYRGLYPLTFLFLEENILMIMLKRAGLDSRIAEDALLLHKESMSTPNSLKIGSNTRKRMLCTGYLHMMLVRVMPLWLLRKIINRGEW